MRRLPAFAALLVTTLLLAACGGQPAQSPESGESAEDGASQNSAPAETTRAEASGESGETGATQEAAGQEAGQAPETGAGQEEQDGASGYSVTTLDGEEVSLGGGNEATALFFMAGW